MAIRTWAAWCGDLLFRVTDTFDDYEDPLAARGVLLVDEIDLHLILCGSVSSGIS
jgi:predicted ATP-binding protein involved in virulence